MFLMFSDLLVLDDKIRDWVLITVTIVVFMVSLVRHNISLYLRSEATPDLKKIQESHTLLRAQRLKTNANKLSASAFSVRKSFFNDPTEGIFRKVEVPAGTSTNPLMNPAMMDPMNLMEMLKRNITMVVPQLLVMAWVQYFFSGFVLVKIPFPITIPFKGMLQRGIELDTLDVTYVSSLSWYFLNVFGLRGINSLVLGEDNAADDAQIMQEQMNANMGMGMGMGMGQTDMKKLYEAERENIELIEHQFALDGAEKRLLGKN